MFYNDKFYQEQGYALATVLIVFALLSTLAGFIMMGWLTQNRLIQKDLNSIKARYYAEAGIYQFLSDPDLWRDTSNSVFNLITIDNKSVVVERVEFGGFWSVTSEASVGKQSKTVNVLVGEKPSDVFQNAVVLGDITTPLMLTGTTK